MDKTLIVNADDFGLTHSVNQGILKCFKDGIVTSASILVNGKASKEAIKLSKENHLSVGIHLTLMDGQPVSKRDQVQSLVDKSGFFPKDYMNFSLKYFRAGISLKDVETEFRSQIEKFLETGLKPAHINGHNHVHMFPRIIDIVIRLMKQYAIKSVRIPDAITFPSWKTPSLNALAKLFLVAFARAARRKISNHGLYKTDFFEGLFISGNMLKKELLRVLDRLKPGVTELMCHPGYEDRELYTLHSWNYNWEEELNALCDNDIKKRINKLGITLASFK